MPIVHLLQATRPTYVRLHVLSDVHLEFGDFEVPEIDADAIVIAGDLHVGTRGIGWIEQHLPEIPVIYVLGNHEYYGEAMPKLLDNVRDAADEADADIRVLSCDCTQVGEVWFVGATLWTDFELLGDRTIGMLAAQDSMSDYRKIRVAPEYRRLRPLDTCAVHHRERKWIVDQLIKLEEHRVVVVTHHAPTLVSVSPHLRSDTVSAAYASSLEVLVGNSGARLWVHGHTHVALDHQVGETRLLSNPRGYVGHAMVEGFQPGLVVEV